MTETDSQTITEDIEEQQAVVAELRAELALVIEETDEETIEAADVDLDQLRERIDQEESALADMRERAETDVSLDTPTEDEPRGYW
jgi:uncharacterized protein YigA (DUF484 family)